MSILLLNEVRLRDKRIIRSKVSDSDVDDDDKRQFAMHLGRKSKCIRIDLFNHVVDLLWFTRGCGWECEKIAALRGRRKSVEVVFLVPIFIIAALDSIDLLNTTDRHLTPIKVESHRTPPLEKKSSGA